jgi:hydroxymethylbilane synthase
MKLRLATRGSKLAWSQSGQVADALRALGHDVELVKVTTHGDVTTAPLASLGGAGVFVGAVRAAVLSGECDFAVHSFKDLPTAETADLALAAVPPREDPADALCTADGRGLDALPAGARVGTGSPRRAAQLLALRPDLQTVDIRGNVETRLARAGADLDAVLLAAAGLTRIGLAARISERLDPAVFLPAPSQGALAIECRADAVEVRAALAVLDHPATRLSAAAERAVLVGLHAGCAAPVGAYADVDNDGLRLTAAVISTDGKTRLVESARTPEMNLAAAASLGARVTTALLAAGAATIVDLSASKPAPLTGRRLLLPTRCPAGLVDALTSAGAVITQAEFTRQEPLPLTDFLDAAALDYDWLVISSAAALTSLADQGFDLAARLPVGTRVAAVGPATARALRAAGMDPDVVANPGGGAALVAAFDDGPGVVLLPGAADASPEPRAGFIAKGWTVRNPAVYRTVTVAAPETVGREWPSYDGFIATAGSVAVAAAELGRPGAPVIAIGASTAVAAREAGLAVIGVAATPDTGGLVDAVLAALA